MQGEADPGWSLTQGPAPSQASACVHSVMSRAKADPKFGEIFRFESPVLMWDQHFTPDTWDRLRTRHVPYGWQGLSHTGTAPARMGWQQMGLGVMGGCGVVKGAQGAQQKGEEPCRDLDLFPLLLPGAGRGFANAPGCIL